MDPAAKVDTLLRESGAVLLRAKCHEIWQLPNGGRFVRSATPSDRRASVNQLVDLRRELGISKPKQHKLEPEPEIRGFRFLTRCVDASDGRELLRLIERSVEIGREEFAAKLHPHELTALETDLGYTDAVPMVEDPHVRYYKSRFNRLPAVFCDAAGVAYIFGPVAGLERRQGCSKKQ